MGYLSPVVGDRATDGDESSNHCVQLHQRKFWTLADKGERLATVEVSCLRNPILTPLEPQNPSLYCFQVRCFPKRFSSFKSVNPFTTAPTHLFEDKLLGNNVEKMLW